MKMFNNYLGTMVVPTGHGNPGDLPFAEFFFIGIFGFLIMIAIVVWWSDRKHNPHNYRHQRKRRK